MQLDVTENASVVSAIREVVERFGRIDVLVNNAGVNLAAPLELTTDDDAMNVIQTNLMGPLRVTRAVLPTMRAQGSGRIVNVGSAGAESRFGYYLVGMYVATKLALRGLSLELAKEVTPFGIEVVLVEGGVGGHTNITTRLLEQAAALTDQPSPYESLARTSLAQAEAMAAAVDVPFAAARLIADACTVPGPGLRYPKDGQAITETSARITDDEYLQLCAGADPTPILERHGIARSYWNVGRA